jgi:hypothetical protein
MHGAWSGERERNMVKYALIQRFQSAGFGSHVLTALEGIYQAQGEGFIPVVDYRKGMDFYREQDGENVWDLYFDQPYKAEGLPDDFLVYRYPATYCLENFTNPKNCFDAAKMKALAPFVREHLKVKREILDKFEGIVRRYNIDFNSTIAVAYRGLDKVFEAPRVSYGRYKPVIDKLLKANSGMRIYIQTDEVEFRDFIARRYPNSFYISEFHVSKKGGGSP